MEQHEPIAARCFWPRVRTIATTCLLGFALLQAELAHAVAAALPESTPGQAEQEGADRYDYFVGLQPSFTVEPYYPAGVFDVDALPLVFEAALGKHLGLRVRTLMNLRIGDGPVAVAATGLSLGTLFYMDRRTPKHAYGGFYGGPVVTGAYNFVEAAWFLILNAEAGYALLVGDAWSISFLGEGGLTLAFRSDGVEPLPHLGFRAVFGYWF